MSVRIPVYVNDAPVGIASVRRDIKGQTAEEMAARDVEQPYRWVVTHFLPDRSEGHGRVTHRPDDGIWVLIAKVSEDIARMKVRA